MCEAIRGEGCYCVSILKKCHGAIMISLCSSSSFVQVHSHLTIRRRLVSCLGCLAKGGPIFIIVLAFSVALLAREAVVRVGRSDAWGTLTISCDGTLCNERSESRKGLISWLQLLCCGDDNSRTCRHYFSKGTIRARTAGSLRGVRLEGRAW